MGWGANLEELLKDQATVLVRVRLSDGPGQLLPAHLQLELYARGPLWFVNPVQLTPQINFLLALPEVYILV